MGRPLVKTSKSFPHLLLETCTGPAFVPFEQGSLPKTRAELVQTQQLSGKGDLLNLPKGLQEVLGTLPILREP
jgi:hypothetical protein